MIMKKKGTQWMLLPVICALLMAACSGNNGDDGGGSSESGSVAMTVRATSPNMKCEILRSASDATEVNTNFVSAWTEGTKVTLWAKQGAKLVYCGEATQNGDASGQHTVKVIHFDGSAVLDPTQPYLLYGLWCDWRRDGEELFYRNDLHRGGSFGTFFKVVGQKGTTSVNEQVAGTVEVLYVINKSGKAIKFRHKGYDAEKKWYYTHAEVSMDKGTVVNAEQGAEALSDVTDIPVFTGNSLGRSYSYYVPNGNKIEDAQLICEIDGKEVRSSNRISSDISLQTNHVYGIFAVWDGERLTLGDGDGNGVIELPEGANVDMGQVNIYGDGINVEVGQDGSFSTDASSVIALGQNDRLMYLNYVSFAPESNKREIKLNAEETAVSLLLPALPNVFFLASDEVVDKLKNLLRELDVTRQLASAIDRSIVSHGYLDMDEIQPEFDVAVDHLVNLMGKRSQSQRNSPLRMRRATIAPANKPEVPDMAPNARMSFVLTDSQWKYGTNPYTNEEQGYWACNFSVTSVRFAAMAILLGHKEETGSLIPYPLEDMMDIFNNLVPAYSAKVIWERVSTLEGLFEQFEIYSLHLHDKDEYHFFDEAFLKDVKLNFYNKDDCIIVMGPTSTSYLLVYHILNGAVCPIVKLIGGELNKYFDKQYQEEKYDLNFDGVSSKYKKFVVSLVTEFAKAKKIDEIVYIVNSDKSKSEKIKEIADIISPVITDKIWKDLQEGVKKSGKSLLFNFISPKFNNSIKEFEKFYKAETKWVDLIMTLVDINLAALGLQEDPVDCLELDLDFNIPNAGLNDIPGHRY